MRYLILIFLVQFSILRTSAQSGFTLEIVPYNIPDLPALHSYAFAQHNGKWLIIGGITGENTFSSHPNYEFLVIDPLNSKFWSYPYEYAAMDIEEPEHLSACFAASQQVGDYLYLVGGMGYLAESEAFGTFPYLTRIEVPALINAIIKKEKISSYFDQIEDESFRTMNATLSVVDSRFFLVGGQTLNGTFNEQGELIIDESPYGKCSIFKISEGEDFNLKHIETMAFDEHFLSLYPKAIAQVFPDGEQGLTIFYNEKVESVNKLSWMNIFDFGYSTHAQPEAEIPQYHSTIIPVYDQKNNKMHTVFLGGCDDYLCSDEQEYAPNMVEEMTSFTRFPDGYTQIETSQIQAYLTRGKDALFLPVNNKQNGIIYLDELGDDNRNLIGYIYGGATTPSPMFYSNGELMDSASNQLFKVYLTKKPAISTLGVLFPDASMPMYRIQVPNK